MFSGRSYIDEDSDVDLGMFGRNSDQRGIAVQQDPFNRAPADGTVTPDAPAAPAAAAPDPIAPAAPAPPPPPPPDGLAGTQTTKKTQGFGPFADPGSSDSRSYF